MTAPTKEERAALRALLEQFRERCAHEGDYEAMTFEQALAAYNNALVEAHRALMDVQSATTT